MWSGQIFIKTVFERTYIHEVHLNQYLYHCKGCGKGYFKHCNLSHHKKSCLGVLVPGFTTPVVNPPIVNPSVPTSTNVTAGDTTTTETSTTETMTTDATPSNKDPLIGGQEAFKFSDPLLPDFDDEDEDNDEDD